MFVDHLQHVLCTGITIKSPLNHDCRGSRGRHARCSVGGTQLQWKLGVWGTQLHRTAQSDIILCPCPVYIHLNIYNTLLISWITFPCIWHFYRPTGNQFHRALHYVMPRHPHMVRVIISAAYRYYWYHWDRYLSSDSHIDTSISVPSIYINVIFSGLAPSIMQKPTDNSHFECITLSTLNSMVLISTCSPHFAAFW